MVYLLMEKFKFRLKVINVKLLLEQKINTLRITRSKAVLHDVAIQVLFISNHQTNVLKVVDLVHILKKVFFYYILKKNQRC